MGILRRSWVALAVLVVFFVNNAAAGCDGIEGIHDDTSVCCAESCDGCDETGCGTASDESNCCPRTIANSDVYCEDNDDGPCIIATTPTPTEDASSGDDDKDETPMPTTTPTSTPMPTLTSPTTKPPATTTSPLDPSNTTATTDDGDEGTSTGVIVLSVMLSALVLGNLACLAWCCMPRFKKNRAPPPSQRDPNTDAELGRLHGLVEAEKTMRLKAEALIHRAKGGGIRPGDFPSVRDVDLHVEQLPDVALAWAEKACAVGGSHPASHATIQTVLQNTFLVCREEVKRCLDERLQSLSAFLGNDEPVLLSGGDAMNLDTQYVLYECLCKGYRTIVSTEPENMNELAGVIHQRCGEPADKRLAGEIIFGAAWLPFEAVMKNYMMVFVEMALQNPQMDFEDNLGDTVPFDARIHRDWAPLSKAPFGQECCIVFPAVCPEEGRPPSNAKIGVVRVPSG